MRNIPERQIDCLIEYRGPEMVMYNRTKDCMSLIPGPRRIGPNNLILFFKEENCTKFENETSFANLWRITDCLRLYNTNRQLILKVKHAQYSNFIY